MNYLSFHCKKYVSRATDWTYPKSAPRNYGDSFFTQNNPPSNMKKKDFHFIQNKGKKDFL